MPPTILFSGNAHMNQPYEFGQSGTARPEPVLVTSPPAKIRTAVEAATSAAKSGSIGNHSAGRSGPALGLEREGDVLGFLLADRHGLRLRAELLVPRLDGVGARRQSLQREGPVRRGHGVVGVIEHANPRVHPA